MFDIFKDLGLMPPIIVRKFNCNTDAASRPLQVKTGRLQEHLLNPLPLPPPTVGQVLGSPT